MRSLLLLAAAVTMLTASAAEAQKKPKQEKQAKVASVLPKGAHYTFTLAAADFDSLEAEEGTAYVEKNGVTEILVTRGTDSALTVTDADGSDGVVAVTLPAGDFTAWLTIAGKKGSATFNGLPLSRGKGKPGSIDATSAIAGDTWAFENAGATSVRLSLYPTAPAAAEPAPTEPAAETPADTAAPTQ